MWHIARATVLLAVLTTLVCSVQAISKVTRQGRYLYTADGNRFYIKGVAYQEQGECSHTLRRFNWEITERWSISGAVVSGANNPFGEPSTFTDPLALSDACARDLPYLQGLGINTIRVYSVDSTLNHDSCMTALSSAGIYTMCVHFTPTYSR
jgi:1,3-beta-glucanosyltransferase GAS1